jgi:RsiW-degrading membrane proteinase PrsW (M82 family)
MVVSHMAGSGIPRRFGWIVVLAVGVLLFEIERRTLIDTGNPNYVPSLILLGAAVVPASFVSFVYGRRLRYGVGAGTLLLIAVLGGVLGTVVAGVLEYKTLVTLGTLPMVAVALTEEASKLIVPLAVLALRRYRSVADGLLVGVASGAGFAALETMGYAFVVLIASRGNIQAVDGVLLLRGVLSPAGHMAWTGLTCAGLWAAAQARWSGRWIAGFVAIFAVAVALHAAWDTVGTTIGYAVVGVFSLTALGVVTHRIAVQSRRLAAAIV